jgi:DNA-binding NtrC family response regulator
MNTNANQADRLLIMEDDANMAEIIAEVAGQLGYQIATAKSVEDCRRVYAELNPTALVLDVILPGEGAAELIPFLAENKCTAPIVLASGLDADVLDTVDRMAQSSGLRVVGVHMKPLLVGQMEAFLRDMLRDQPVS